MSLLDNYQYIIFWVLVLAVIIVCIFYMYLQLAIGGCLGLTREQADATSSEEIALHKVRKPFPKRRIAS